MGEIGQVNMSCDSHGSRGCSWGDAHGGRGATLKPGGCDKSPEG